MFLCSPTNGALMSILQTIPDPWRATGGRQGSIQKGGCIKRAYTKTTMSISKSPLAWIAWLCGVVTPVHNTIGQRPWFAQCGHRITPPIGSPSKGSRDLPTNVGLWEPLQGVPWGRWTWIRDTRLWHRQHIWSRRGTKCRREHGRSLEGDHRCSVLGAKTSCVSWIMDSQWSWATVIHEGRPIWLHHCAFPWPYCKGRGTLCVTCHNPPGTPCRQHEYSWKRIRVKSA